MQKDHFVILQDVQEPTAEDRRKSYEIIKSLQDGNSTDIMSEVDTEGSERGDTDDNKPVLKRSQRIRMHKHI